MGGSGQDRHNGAAWLVDRHVARGGGDRLALRCQGRSTTYAGLQAEVWRAQHALAALGVGAGERVAMVCDDDEAWVALFLGALRSGVVPVPLSTMLTTGELAAIVTDAQAAAVAVSGRHAGHLGVLGALPSVRATMSTGAGDGAGVAWADVDDRSEAPLAGTGASTPAFWLYSSGTTGTPKGVVHRHGSLRATAETYAADVLGTEPGDRCLSVAKLFFAFGLGNSLTFPLAAGATSILHPERPTPPGITALVAAEAPTLFFASPGFVAALLDADADPAAFASVRATVTAGEALPAELARRWVAHVGSPVLDGIGSTEALHIFCSNRVGDVRPGSSGRPVAGWELRLVDDHGGEVTGADTPGNLLLRGPSTAEGYWRRPEATAAAFLDGGWVRSGDVYTRSADGCWTFLGRGNDMIKAGGIWVSPAEVEAVLVEHPDVLEAAVVGARDDAGLEQAVAFVVPRAGHAVDRAALDAHCRARMASFKRPRRLLVVDELPKTATGKIQRFALRRQLGAQGPAAGPPPAGPSAAPAAGPPAGPSAAPAATPAG